MRLFVAVQPPPAAVAELAAALAPLHKLPDADRLRFTEQAGWHLTLAFLGDVDPSLLPELGTRLARAAHRHEPMELRLAGGGRFADRALWTGVTDGRRALGRLADSTAAAARRTGIDADERPFKAHLTLARSRSPVDLRPFRRALEGFEGSAWPADSIRLMSSTTAGVGQPPVYETVERWPLGKGADKG
ncbi:RNA 2',3'-cyclic phosphodiesterase [Wenjunlia tyrosinilytica]|uniref:RNA 2',3'-cyclic phosphodiesterase n=1 Tax=Wenjunlia tyrosinilytica TaxID=1544741 RepID=A0A917ZMW0_9ACTN|nr:RNA 2',3'-cyclic phosphodiesterase [Wenjunlia tyrosinilytica]GGO86933.1 RNA 2',3'-cyclic phosphodiesterase [Wenjunlia tyrosinilytica]